MDRTADGGDERYLEDGEGGVPFGDPVPSAVDEEWEGDLPPEDENAAGEINTGGILAAVLGVVAVVLLIVVFAGGGGGRREEPDELDKAGSKYEAVFRERPPEEVPVASESAGGGVSADEGDGRDDVEDILATLPEELQDRGTSGRAPVAAAGGSPASSRPDTRNSKSPRRVDGLKGLDSAAQPSGRDVAGTVPEGSERMTKEQYIARMMSRTEDLQQTVYGGATSYGGEAYREGRQAFFLDGSGGGGDGRYLSYGSLWDGTVISGALVTAINTDNPGLVIARVTENVYSSYDHSFLLIPEGSLLYATYNSSVSYGQDRVQVAWNLLIRPDGYRVALGNMNGVDSRGMSGYKGRVDNHIWEKMKALGLIAVYSIVQTEAASGIGAQDNEFLRNAMTDAYAGVQDIGDRVAGRALDIGATITLAEGSEIKLITNVPLELPPVEVREVTRRYVRTR